MPPTEPAGLAITLDDGTPAARAITLPDGSVAMLSDSDAECCCDDAMSDCYIKILPCFCSLESEARYLENTDELATLWPESDRESGGAISIDGVCYGWYGNHLGVVPQSLILDISSATASGNCHTAPCLDQEPCPECDNGGYTARIFGDCDYPGESLECVGRTYTLFHASGRETLTSSTGVVLLSRRVSVSRSVLWEADASGVIHLRSWAYSASYFEEQYTAGGSFSERTVGVARYSTGDNPNGYISSTNGAGLPGILGGLWGANATFENGDVTRTFASGSEITLGGTFGVSGSLQGIESCNDSYSDGDSSATLDKRFGLSGGHSNATTSLTTGNGSVREMSGNSSVVNLFTNLGENGELPSFELCTDPRIARACNPETVPQVITYDRDLAPEWALSARNTENDELYALTLEISEDEPIEGLAYSTEECEGVVSFVAIECGGERRIAFDPDSVSAESVTLLHEGVRYSPTDEVSADDPVSVTGSPDPCPGEWFIAVRCGSLPNDADFPDQPVFKYQVEPGMVAGEGTVIAHWTDGGDPGTPGVCRHTFFLRPTTTPTTPGSDFFERQIPGNCSTAIGGRSGECVDGTRPVRFPIIERRPGGLGTMLKGTINTAARIATLGRVKQVKQCSGCKNREDQLNQIGQSVAQTTNRILKQISS